MGEEEKEVSVEQLKESGNSAVRSNKFEEAILYYTQAVKMEPTNYTLFSNRSFAFLQIRQYYFAMEDAIETIKLNPIWAKGHFRKGEVEFATYRFGDALKSYDRALQLKPDDKGIANAITKALREEQKDNQADVQIPWVGAGTGIVLGVIIVIADFVGTSKPTLTHPILMAVMTMTIAMIGYGIARACRYYVKCQRDSLLEAPINLFKEDLPSDNGENDSSKSSVTSNHRYTKSQARQRYKKGKT